MTESPQSEKIMKRDEFDALIAVLKTNVSEGSIESTFPLDKAVTLIAAQDAERAALSVAHGGDVAITKHDQNLLALFDITAVSSAVAIKRLSGRDGELAGITTALVDLWGQAEASRCLWFDSHANSTGEGAQARRLALGETVKIMAPEAISIAFRLVEPVTRYVEFVSKVMA